MIATNIIIIWPGTNVSIPSGFTRETTLDSKYPKGAATLTDPNVTGGNASHTHTSPAHSHTIDSHSHIVNTNEIGSTNADTDGSGTEISSSHHHHSTVAGISGGALSSVAATYDTCLNDPPYYDVIYIKSSGKRPIPDDAIVLWNEADPPSGFNICNGDGGLTPDLRNKYLKGASTGADSGGTGGSTTNVHALTHTHVEGTHAHSASVYEGGDVSAGGMRGFDGTNYCSLNHTHSYVLSSTAPGGVSNPSDFTTAEVVEPAYSKLSAIRNTSGVSKIPKKGIIALWLGTLATIPVGWKVCDGNNSTPNLLDKYFKIINTAGEIGYTGGSNTHTHAAQSHLHTGASHNHTYSSGDLDHSNDAGKNGYSGSYGCLWRDQSHSVDSIGSNTSSWGAVNTTADSANNEPSYRTVCYIMLKNPPSGMIQEN